MSSLVIRSFEIGFEVLLTNRIALAPSDCRIRTDARDALQPDSIIIFSQSIPNLLSSSIIVFDRQSSPNVSIIATGAPSLEAAARAVGTGPPPMS